MSDVKVTRGHREAALAAWNGPNPPRAVLAVNSVLKPWLETGRLTHDGSPIASLAIALQRIALDRATAEHNVRAAIIADLEAILTRSRGAQSLVPDDDVEYVEADSIRNLIETLEAQQQ